VASCRRVEVSVTDRFGEVTTVEDQICANEDGAAPPRAWIEISDRRVVGQNMQGAARIVLSRLWIDDREVEDGAELPDDGACHVIEMLVADEEGRIGLDQRFACGDPDAPRIALGADPTFCPRRSETLRICAEVIDPLGRGVEPIAGEPVPLDDCAGLIPSSYVDRIVVRGETGDGVIHGSMIACTAPSEGRPNLLFAQTARTVTVVRGETRSAAVSVYGGEPPYSVEGALDGTSNIGISRSGIAGPVASIDLSVPRSGTWDLLELVVTDSRGLTAAVTASVATMDPTMMMMPPVGQDPQAAVSFGCSAPGVDGIAWWILIALPLFWRRR
jgi:hypothetical protein